MRRIVFSLFVFLCALKAEAQPTNINLGTGANTGTGTDLRTSLGILSTNDTYLYNLINGLSVGGGTDKIATNNGTAYGLTVQVAQTNAYVTGSKLATFDAAKRLTNSAYADTDFPTKANNLSDIANAATARANLGWTTIYATDRQFGAVGDYNGTQNTAGTGTDNRVAIQAALNAAYTQGSGGVNDTINGISYRVVIPKGKYFISAPSDGTPSLVVPLKCELDFSEAELFFDKPPTNDFGHGILEPNPLWCGIKIGNMAGLVIGKMQMILSQDLTYGGAWYGMSLDAIRVQESDISWILGGGREHYILGFGRGAGIRYIACWNAFVKDINISASAFGIIQSYFGTAFSGYTRYRGTSGQESVCTSLWVNNCSFLNIYKKAIYVGVNGDYHAPAAVTSTSGAYEIGGFEVVTFDRTVNGGPISISQCAFENIAEEPINVTAQSGLFISDIRLEETGQWPSLGTIYASTVRSFKLDGCTWNESGSRAVYHAHYTGALDQISSLNPAVFVRVDETDVSPTLENVYLNNQASSGCQLVNGTANITRLPIVINYRTEASTQMQGTSTYMQSMIPENDGGRIWSPSIVGIAPQETVNGSNTTFTFLNGFTRQKPRFIRFDGLSLRDTNSDGTTNWTWDSTAKTVTTSIAPTKDLRAFF